MRLKQFAFLLLITLASHSLLSQENNKSENFIYENDIQNTLKNKEFGKVIIHVVKKGDTLSSISKKYSIKKELIIKENKLLDENYIFIGQNLKIVNNLNPENSYKAYYHKIKKGENLTDISYKYNLSLSKLLELNGIKSQDILKVGTKLKVKEEIPANKDSTKNEKTDLLEIEKLIKRNKYGPLIINFEKTIPEKREKLLKATNKNGKTFFLNLNCDKKEINVRGIGRKWKGWMPAKENFEDELLNDFCLEFN